MTGGVLALLARPLISRLSATIVDLTPWDVTPDRFWLKAMFHPHIRRLGDVRGAVAFSNPSPLLLAGADRRLTLWTKAIYKLAGQPTALTISSELHPRHIPKWISTHVAQP